MKKVFYDFLGLIYPDICAVCAEVLFDHEQEICEFCWTDLPLSNYHLLEDNPVSRLFYGRVPIEGATSYYLFNKGTRVQKLLHTLKYKNRPQVAEVLGRRMGNELMHSKSFRDIDLIIPVPLHKNRMRERSYNQSYFIARGLAENWNKPVLTEVLYRERYTGTQTRKGRFQRWKNVENSFSLHNPDKIKGKHVLLVDDVVTTGATLEACARQLREVAGVRVSVLTIAYAQ